MASSTVVVYTDHAIQQAVLDELAWEHQVPSTEVGVIVKGGVVTLTGTVDSYLKRWAAQDAAHHVRGVTAVANDIEVRLPSNGERTDGELASACLFALRWDAAISPAAVEVTVSKGWVTLKGEVEWPYQRHSAERVVGRLAGVTGVSNLMTVAKHPVPNDVKPRIERALVRSAQLDAKGIEVEIHQGTVILKGTVSSYAEKQAAARTAWTAPGITAVDNQLKVVVPG